MRWIGLFLLDGERRPFELEFDIETNSWTHFPEWLQTQLHDYLARDSEQFLTKFNPAPMGPYPMDPTLEPTPVDYEDEEFIDALAQYNLLPVRPSTCRLRYDEPDNPISWYGSESLFNVRETLYWLSDCNVIEISEEINGSFRSSDERMRELWEKYPNGVDRDGCYLWLWVEKIY